MTLEQRPTTPSLQFFTDICRTSWSISCRDDSDRFKNKNTKSDKGEACWRVEEEVPHSGIGLNISLDTHILSGVYYERGIRFRNHCGAEPPRDIEPPGLVTAVGWRDRAST